MHEKEHANGDEPIHHEPGSLRHSHVPARRPIHAHLVFPRGLAAGQVPVPPSALLARRERLREHAHVSSHRHRPLLCHCASVQAAHEARRVLSTHSRRLDRVHIHLVASCHLYGAASHQQQTRTANSQMQCNNHHFFLLLPKL